MDVFYTTEKREILLFWHIDVYDGVHLDALTNILGVYLPKVLKKIFDRIHTLHFPQNVKDATVDELLVAE